MQQTASHNPTTSQEFNRHTLLLVITFSHYGCRESLNPDIKVKNKVKPKYNVTTL